MELATLPPWQLAKRDGIVDAAAELLRDRPADAIHMREVAAHAGVALGTLYRYFRSKEQVYLAVLQKWAAWDLTPPAITGRTPAERLRARVAMVVSSVEESPHFFLLELGLQASADAEIVQAQRQWSAGGAAWLATDLQVLGPERGERTAVMLWAIVNHVLKEATLGRADFDVGREVIDGFVALLERDLNQVD